MNYEKALKAWGAKKLNERFADIPVDEESVEVKVEFDPGYVCCTGPDPDPDCYCSFAEEASVKVTVTGTFTVAKNDTRLGSCDINFEDFDFSAFLKELLDVSEGTITS